MGLTLYILLRSREAFLDPIYARTSADLAFRLLDKGHVPVHTHLQCTQWWARHPN